MYAIVMEEASRALNEVVVIGYGVVKKKDLTGAVAAVKGEELVNKRTSHAFQCIARITLRCDGDA